MSIKSINDKEFGFKSDLFTVANIIGLIFTIGFGVIIYGIITSLGGSFTAWELTCLIVTVAAIMPIKKCYENEVRKLKYIEYLGRLSFDDLKKAVSPSSHLDRQSQIIIDRFIEEFTRQSE